MAGKLLIRLGHWLEARFPEKVQAEVVYGRLSAVEEYAIKASESVNVLDGRLGRLESAFIDLSKKVEVLASDNNALKTQAALRTRVASSFPAPGR